jgi:hypothetical protein
MNLDVMNDFDERQLLCLRFNELGRRKEPSMSVSLVPTLTLCFNALYCKTSFSSQHIPSHRTAPHLHVTSGRARAPHRTARPAGRTAAPRLASATATARRGERARARVWFTVLLLPASQVVYTKSTL